MMRIPCQSPNCQRLERRLMCKPRRELLQTQRRGRLHPKLCPEHLSLPCLKYLSRVPKRKEDPKGARISQRNPLHQEGSHPSHQKSNSGPKQKRDPYNDPVAEIVYSKHPVTETWTLHTPTVGGALGRQQFTPSAFSSPTLPLTASQATVSIQGVCCRVLNSGIQTPLLPPPPPASIEEEIAGLPPELKCAMDFLSSPDGFETISLAIAEGRCYAVSDGFFKDTCGTAAFMLVTLDDQGHINVVLTVPGPIPEGNSYRCELTGIYGSSNYPVVT
jgi:hypothetical protein